MKSVSIRFFAVIFLIGASFPTAAQADQNTNWGFPSLDSAWTVDKYALAVALLDSGLKKGQTLPHLGSKRQAIFEKLTTFDNLNIFIDKSLSPDDRFRRSWPLYELIPKVLTLYGDAEMQNECAVIAVFMMEMMRRSTLLGEEKRPDWSAEKWEQFKAQFGKAVFQTSSGVLTLLLPEAQEEIEIESAYQISLSEWFQINLPSLWSWFTFEDRETLKKSIETVSKTHIDKQVREQMTSLLSKIH